MHIVAMYFTRRMRIVDICIISTFRMQEVSIEMFSIMPLVCIESVIGIMYVLGTKRPVFLLRVLSVEIVLPIFIFIIRIVAVATVRTGFVHGVMCNIDT